MVILYSSFVDHFYFAKDIKSSLFDISESSGVWLGGSDLLQEDKWKWDKPTRSITYYDWGYYNGIPQPNDLFNQDCLTYGLSDPFETQYTWDDQTCSNDYPFLCER